MVRREMVCKTSALAGVCQSNLATSTQQPIVVDASRSSSDARPHSSLALPRIAVAPTAGAVDQLLNMVWPRVVLCEIDSHRSPLSKFIAAGHEQRNCQR